MLLSAQAATSDTNEMSVLQAVCHDQSPSCPYKVDSVSLLYTTLSLDIVEFVEFVLCQADIDVAVALGWGRRHGAIGWWGALCNARVRTGGAAE